jgi:hypothetical protein
VNISLKHIHSTTNMLDSEVGWIKNDLFNLVRCMDYVLSNEWQVFLGVLCP